MTSFLTPKMDPVLNYKWSLGLKCKPSDNGFFLSPCVVFRFQEAIRFGLKKMCYKNNIQKIVLYFWVVNPQAIGIEIIDVTVSHFGHHWKQLKKNNSCSSKKDRMQMFSASVKVTGESIPSLTYTIHFTNVIDGYKFSFGDRLLTAQFKSALSHSNWSDLRFLVQNSTFW
jgi:hypothetical protein